LQNITANFIDSLDEPEILSPRLKFIRYAGRWRESRQVRRWSSK